MAKHNFGEKKTENIKGVECPVWQTPKYEQSKNKAIEMIESNKYGLSDGDFWILMNTYANGSKVMYTGLIISHNGCMKINDKLDSKDKFYSKHLKMTMLDSKNLFYEYNDGELYEVGEVNDRNCRNDYPLAMAYKRCYDRVVLKKSKLAFYGVYSEVEAEEFKEKDPREVEEYENEEISKGTWRSYIDNALVGHDDLKKFILEKYNVKTTDKLDTTLNMQQIDALITWLKAKTGATQ